MANDSRNGFTRLNPSDLLGNKAVDSGVFYSGGGRHITLAAVKNTVCYATWIDGGGPEQGRVDVVNLKKADGDSVAYSFRLPSGVIHGATTNSGKVFFAPADGVCWIQADTDLKQTAESVVVNHISLGKDTESDKPLRTGAFANQRNWVLFSTGSGEQSSLCLLDAAASQPAVVRVPIQVADGLSLMSPEVVLVAGGKRYAFLFQDRKDKETEIQEQLSIVELDPNGDRNFSDAKLVRTMPVGRSLPDGHYGHHSICFDSEGRHAILTNPGDGSIWVMSLHDLQVRARSKVGGIPSAISAIGAPPHHH
jgi:hypothetical protein